MTELRTRRYIPARIANPSVCRTTDNMGVPSPQKYPHGSEADFGSQMRGAVCAVSRVNSRTHVHPWRSPIA